MLRYCARDAKRGHGIDCLVIKFEGIEIRKGVGQVYIVLGLRD